MSLLLTYGLGVDDERQPGVRPVIHDVVNLKPKVTSARNLRPEPYDVEVPDDDELKPTIHDVTNLKPSGVSARNLRPKIYDTEES